MIKFKDVKVEVTNFKEYKNSSNNNSDYDSLLVFYCGENLYNSLNIFLKFLYETKDNDYMYKWAVLSIHSALVEFMISSIRGNNWRNVTTKNKNMENKIISTMSLYSMIEKEYFYNNKGNKKRKELVERLNNLRNMFSHPDYDLNFIDKSLLIKLFKNSIDIIETLAINSQNVKDMLDNVENKNISDIIIEIKDIMEKI